VDRQAIARAERRRQALEALEFERSRAAALRERLETVAVELEGAAIDAAAIERMAPEDVAVVREALQDEAPGPDAEDGEDGRAEHLAWLEEELVRLEGELAASDVRARAFERYLDALGR
jgi:hypothetical protein